MVKKLSIIVIDKIESRENMKLTNSKSGGGGYFKYPQKEKRIYINRAFSGNSNTSSYSSYYNTSYNKCNRKC